MATEFFDTALLVGADWTAAALVGGVLDSVFPPSSADTNVWWQGVEALLELAAGMIVLRQVSAYLDPEFITIPGTTVIYDAIAVSFYMQYSPQAMDKLGRVYKQLKATVNGLLPIKAPSA